MYPDGSRAVTIPTAFPITILFFSLRFMDCSLVRSKENVTYPSVFGSNFKIIGLI